MPVDMRKWDLLFALLTIAISSTAFGATRWPQFRGPNGSGVSEDDKPPVEFSPMKSLLWKTPIPRGHSSPCIWDDRVFLTAQSKGKLETICINRADGHILWRQPAPVQKLAGINGVNSTATPTACTDGQRVYVLFGSFGLLAYDFDGKEIWRKPLPLTNVRHGLAASPILAGGRLIVNGDQEDMESFLIAVDPKNGDTLWQTPRPRCFSSHGTPIYLKRDSAEEVLVSGTIRLVAYDLKDGAERWSCRGLEAISICPSPTTAEGTVYACSFSMSEKLPTWDQLVAGYDKNKDGKLVERECPRLIKDVFSIVDANHDGFITKDEWEAAFGIFKQADNGLLAIRPGQQGDVTETNILWKQPAWVAEVASPLVYAGRVYAVKGGGFLSCFDAKTGKAFYQNKRIGAEGQYFASPIAAGGKVYLASNLGVVTVIEPGDELKVVARNELDEAIAATPAMADNKIYVRTAENLWAFGEK